MRIVKISFTVIIALLIMHTDIYANSSTKVSSVVKNVVVATEEGYVESSKGVYALPGRSNVVNMDAKSFDKLVELLEANKGKTVKLYLYDNVIVGLKTSNKIEFAPKFKENHKLKYKDKPIKISTTMKFWSADTYRLSISTENGTYCIDNGYEYSDYYIKVYEKLISKVEMNKDIKYKIDVYFHDLESDECLGEIEDIHLDDSNTTQ